MGFQKLFNNLFKLVFGSSKEAAHLWATCELIAQYLSIVNRELYCPVLIHWVLVVIADGRESYPVKIGRFVQPVDSSPVDQRMGYIDDYAITVTESVNGPPLSSEWGPLRGTRFGAFILIADGMRPMDAVLQLLDHILDIPSLRFHVYARGYVVDMPDFCFELLAYLEHEWYRLYRRPDAATFLRRWRPGPRPSRILAATTSMCVSMGWESSTSTMLSSGVCRHLPPN